VLKLQIVEPVVILTVGVYRTFSPIN